MKNYTEPNEVLLKLFSEKEGSAKMLMAARHAVHTLHGAGIAIPPTLIESIANFEYQFNLPSNQPDFLGFEIEYEEEMKVVLVPKIKFPNN